MSHPEVVCHGEILIGYGGRYRKMPPKVLKPYRRVRTLWQAVMSGALLFPRRTIDNTLCDTTVLSGAVGFRIMYNQMARDPRVLPHLQAFGKLKVIHLYRENLLKQFVSLRLMHAQQRHRRDSAHVYTPPPIARARINPQEAMRFVEEMQRQRAYYSNVFSKFQTYEVKYEDMISTSGLNVAIQSGLCDFLQVSNVTMNSRQVKMNPAHLSDFVANYDELASALQAAGYAHFID